MKLEGDVQDFRFRPGDIVYVPNMNNHEDIRLHILSYHVEGVWTLLHDRNGLQGGFVISKNTHSVSCDDLAYYHAQMLNRAGLSITLHRDEIDSKGIYEGHRDLVIIPNQVAPS